MEPVRLAVVGAGLIGGKHARLITSQSECSLVGLCDVDCTCRSLAEECSVPFYQDIEELLERQRPEGVIIATPNGTHSTMAEICARHSVDILIEKPITDTLHSANSLVEVANEAGIQVLVGHHRRYNPFIQETRSIVQGGELGKLVAVSMMWTLMKPPEYYDVSWRCRRPDGGPTLINLIHELDLLRFICGEINQVYAQSGSGVRGLDVEDSISLTLSFENGAVGSVLASDATPAPWSYELAVGENPHYFHTGENCYYFLGSSASFAFPRMELWSYADPDHMGWQYPLGKTCQEMVGADPLVLQLEHFCRVIRDEELPIVNGRDGTQSLAVALAVLESIDCRLPVFL